MPLHIPQAVTMAARRPRANPWVTTKMLSGPGAMVRAMEAPRKRKRVVRVMLHLPGQWTLSSL